MNPSRLLTVLSLLFAIAFLAGSGFWLLHNLPPGHYEKTIGKVVDISYRGSGEDVDAYPIVEYEVDGLTLTVRANQRAEGLVFEGWRRPVYYDPQFPGSAVTITFFEIVLGPGALVLVGLAALAVFVLRLRMYGLGNVEDEPPGPPPRRSAEDHDPS